MLARRPVATNLRLHHFDRIQHEPYIAFLTTAPGNDASSRSASVEVGSWSHKTLEAAETRNGSRAAFSASFCTSQPRTGAPSLLLTRQKHPWQPRQSRAARSRA